jgi:hypothetical protein
MKKYFYVVKNLNSSKHFMLIRVFISGLLISFSQFAGAIVKSYQIMGNAGIGEVELSFVDTVPKKVVTDASGYYTITVSDNWSGTITPSKTGYIFAPSVNTYTNVVANQWQQYFYAKPLNTVLTIAKTNSAPFIDGYTDGDPWSLTSWINMTALVSGNTSTTMSSAFKLLYDDDNLYILAKQTGNNDLDTSNNSFWLNDSYAIYIKMDTTDSIDGKYTYDGTYSFWMRRGSYFPDRFMADHSSRFMSADAVDVQQDDQPTSFTQEWRISWKSLIGNTNWNHKNFKFEIMAIDCDYNNRKQVYFWRSATDREYTDTRSFTPVELASPFCRKISGSTGGVKDVTLTYTDTIVKTVKSDAAGKYSISVPDKWTGTIKPSLEGYKFSPETISFNNVEDNFISQNFSATATSYLISGNTLMPGVTLSYTDTTAKTVVSDANGNYSFRVSVNFTGSVTPSLNCYTFSPAKKEYLNLQSDKTSQIFTSLENTYTISGNLGVGGATLYADGVKTVTSESNGNYSLIVKCNWTGNLVPVMGGYSFSPDTIFFKNNMSNQTSQNFSPTKIRYTISGNAGTEGAKLTFTDTTAKTVITDASGNYSFDVSYKWSGTVIPSKEGMVFLPLNKSYSSVANNMEKQDYSASTNSLSIAEGSNYEIFPVPASDFLYIKFNKKKDESIKLNIVNALGKVIWCEESIVGFDNLKKVDVSNFSKGVYFIKVISGTEIQTRKIVIK